MFPPGSRANNPASRVARKGSSKEGCHSPKRLNDKAARGMEIHKEQIECAH